MHLEAVPLRQSCLCPGLNFLFLLSFVSENIVTVHQSGGDHDLVMVDTSQQWGDRSLRKVRSVNEECFKL